MIHIYLITANYLIYYLKIDQQNLKKNHRILIALSFDRIAVRCY